MVKHGFRKSIPLFALSMLWAGGSTLAAQERPNILWLTSEDNSADWIGCYGNPRVETPNLDRLATQGFQYMHAFSNGPSCSPSRSTWITGVMALSMGTHHQRCFLPIPDSIPFYTEPLKQAGYYTGNDTKTDYNISGRDRSLAWDNLGKVKWSELKSRQPFFQVINFYDSHSSKLRGDIEHTEFKPEDVLLPAHYPDVPIIRKNLALYYDCIKRMDASIGSALNRLEDEGLAEDTIVIYNSDHGGAVPRAKGFIFRDSLHCPLIIRIPEKYKDLWPEGQPGSKVDRLVSFVDMPKTWVSLAGGQVPAAMQGTIFLGPDTEPEQQYHMAFRGRQADMVDNSRAICDKRFLYIRNYMPYAPWMQFWKNNWDIPLTAAWYQTVRAGEANEVQSRFFSAKGWPEELYDMERDPDCVNNLIDNPEYRETAVDMRKALRRKQVEIYDAGLLPESEIGRLAKANGTTIYEMAHDPKIYNVNTLLDAADLALAKDPENRSKLRGMLESLDIGQRYWGMVGCLLLDDQASGFKGIVDASDEIRALAAWLLIRTGEKEAGYGCIRDLLSQRSYACMTILDMVDWMDEADAQMLVPAVRNLDTDKVYPNKQAGFVKAHLIERYGE